MNTPLYKSQLCNTDWITCGHRSAQDAAANLADDRGLSRDKVRLICVDMDPHSPSAQYVVLEQTTYSFIGRVWLDD